MTDPQLDIDRFAEEVLEFLTSVTKHAGFDLHPRIEGTEDNQVHIEFAGADLAFLLGHNAEVLNAFEYLSSRVFAHYLDAGFRLRLDGGQYRARREQELRLMAQAAAERVKKFRKPFPLDPMTPSERRIIHLALIDETGVRTESIGDGDDRKIVIHPA